MAAPRIYMDWNATAPLLPEARAAVLDVLDRTGNPSSVHFEGRALRAAVESARREVAALCGATPGGVIFTSGATEAANLVLTPEFRMGRTPLNVGALYVSAIEHPAVREGGRFAPDRVATLPVDADGILDLEALDAALAGHDKSLGLPMVAVMLANNETGVIQPIPSISARVKSAGGLLVVDAVQAAGRLPLDLATLGADFLIVSSHKLGGPKGAGALVARGEVLMPAPLIRGGGQERGHRSGTENPAALAGFGVAARIAAEDIPARMARIEGLRSRLENGMRALAPDVEIHAAGVARIGNTSFFSLPGLKAETGHIAFDLEGIALSAGSACASGKVGQSHVLTAMGRDAGQGGLRISIGPSTGEAGIDRCLQAFGKIAGRRRLSGAAA